jgi:hypothetical protein
MPQTQSTPYLRRSNLQPSDFLIGQKQNETRYVPSSLVPTEIEGEINRDEVDFFFRYISPESASSRKFRNRNVELQLGRSTKKILQISVSFEPNYPALISAIEQAIKTVKLAKSDVNRLSIQKSYTIIVDFLETAKRDFITNMKQDLEEMFRQKPS